MELIGKLKNEVDQATSKEEARELIEKAGMKLTDEELDKVKLKDDDLEKVSGGLAPTNYYKPMFGQRRA